MKKIMIYTKHKHIGNKSVYNLLKSNSSIFVLYISLLCGTITGSTILNNNIRFAAIFSDNAGNLSNYYIFIPVITLILTLIISFCSGLSCFGIIIQIFIIFFYGILSGVLPIILLNTYGNKGILLYLLNLPGIIIILCTMILFGNITDKVSNNISYNILKDKNERIDLRAYLIDFFISTGICFSGILINIILHNIIK